MSNQTFEEFVLAGCPPAEVFRPFASYDPDGDCIEFFATNESFYGERLGPLVTIYRGQETGEVVGVLVEDIKDIMAGPSPKSAPI